jgi:HPr kinase/phosphorylase
MHTDLTARAIFTQYQNILELEWISGQQQADSPVTRHQLDRQTNTLVGHMNLIRPNLVQVLGESELNYLEELGNNSRQDAIDTLFSNQPLMLIFSDAVSPTGEILEQADRHGVPAASTPLSADQVIDNLRNNLTSLVSEKMIQHGVFMEVMGLGVLLTGPSGVGKSELALELLSRGHRLIADDAPEFRHTAPEIILGKCPAMLSDFLEVRGLGILNVRAMYGNNAVIQEKRLHLIIQLQTPDNGDELESLDRLDTNQRHHRILGVDIPEVILPVAPGRDLSVIIEAAVRNHVLILNGYNATEDFIERQHHYLNKNNA